jgi:hypothetical protein
MFAPRDFTAFGSASGAYLVVADGEWGGAIKHAIGLPVAGVNSGLLIRGQSKVIK